jgi:hypothetical protein
MHQDFPKLYAEISADGAERDKRWAGVEKFTSTYTVSRTEVLVRLAFQTKPPAGGHRQEELEQSLAAFHKAFADSDPSFEPGGRQDQVLAAASLLHMFKSNSKAALAVTTTACGGARKAILPIDLVTSAENALFHLAASRRKRPDLSKVKVNPPELEFEPDFDNVQVNQPATFKDVFDQFLGKMEEAFSDLAEQYNSSIEKIIETTKKADEELDMLSWVFGGRALLPDQVFGEVPVLQKPLVFARDLATLTTISPGPSVVSALMSRAGIKSTGKLTITDAVNAVSDNWTAAGLKGRNLTPPVRRFTSRSRSGKRPEPMVDGRLDGLQRLASMRTWH